jgi:hypothetical protein
MILAEQGVDLPLDWAEQKQLIGVGEIGDVGYLWLARLEERENEDAIRTSARPVRSA